MVLAFSKFILVCFCIALGLGLSGTSTRSRPNHQEFVRMVSSDLKLVSWIDEFRDHLSKVSTDIPEVSVEKSLRLRDKVPQASITWELANFSSYLLIMHVHKGALDAYKRRIGLFRNSHFNDVILRLDQIPNSGDYARILAIFMECSLQRIERAGLDVRLEDCFSNLNEQMKTLKHQLLQK